MEKMIDVIDGFMEKHSVISIVIILLFASMAGGIIDAILTAFGV